MSESTSNKCDLPACWTTEKRPLWAVAMLLEQPESDANSGPVGSKACEFRLIEDLDSSLDFADYHFLGFLKQLTECVIPLEWSVWFQEFPKR